MSIQDEYAQALESIRDSKAKLAESARSLTALLPQVADARSRGKIRQHIWTCLHALQQRPHHFSQAGQDAFLDEQVFKGKTGGVFVEVGGYDGITGSNGLFFELMRGWTGLIIEPSPVYHALCEARRTVPCARLAVGSAPGRAEFLEITGGMKQMGGLIDSYDPDLRARVEADPRHQGEVIEVEVQPLAEILSAHGLRRIDYISLDVEGAEKDVIATFPFAEFDVTAWSIENNSGATEVPALMQANGYQRVEAIGVDDIYLRRG